MPPSYNLPELVKKEIGALVKAEYYSSKSDVVKDALRALLDSKRKLRLASAVELYKDREITLGKIESHRTLRKSRGYRSFRRPHERQGMLNSRIFFTSR